MEAVSDNRYSLTWRSDSYTGNLTVGEVCLSIVASYLEVYRPYIDTGEKINSYAHTFFRQFENDKQIQDWWRGRKDQSLAGLQIEAMDWAISKRQEELNGRPDARLKRLIALRDELKKTRRCLSPGGIPSAAGFETRQLIQNLDPSEATALTQILTLTKRVAIDESSKAVIGVELDTPVATNATLKYVEKLPHLEVLDLSGSKVGDAGLRRLAGLSRLETLRLERTKVTAEEVHQLQRALPRCTIIWTSPTRDGR